METYFINQEKDFAEILLHGQIGMWQQADSKKFICDLKNLEKNYKKINIRINTVGGDVFAGIAIYNALKNSTSEIHCYVDGIAASMGSVICLAGKKIFMSKYGQLMIHRVSGTVVSADSDKLVETAKLMTELENSLIDIYANRTGISKEEIRNNWMARGKEKWFTADQALESKLVDEIYDMPLSKQPPKNIPVNKAWEFYNENFLTIYNKRKMENLLELSAFYNLSENATVQDILASMQNERNENQNLKSEIESLKTENQNFLNQLEVESKNKIQNLIDSAIKEKRILETQRSIYTALAESNFTATKSALESIKAYVSITSQLQNNSNDSSEPMSILDWQKKNPKGLAEMQNKNPELYCSLYEKHYGVKPKLNNSKN